MKKLIFPVAIIAMMMVVSCSKKDNATQVQADSTAAGTTTQTIAAKTGFPSLSLMSSKMRKYKKGAKGCTDSEENCHPVDIVITGVQRSELMSAIKGGGTGIKQLFSMNEKAVGLIPDWNEKWFADVKTAILSGNYTFLQANESVFLLGREGKVSADNFDYTLSYVVR